MGQKTLDKISIMHSYEDGKTIEVQSPIGSKWQDWTKYGEPQWDWANHDYRVKPEPRVYYTNVYENGKAGLLSKSRQEAIDLRSTRRADIIKLVEVIEESP